jgi:AcrR family transcriptional regulator
MTTTPARRRPPRPHGRTATRAETHAATRERMVQAARQLVAGGAPLTLRAVARELGVTAPALYRYAASHEDLVLMVALAIDADAARRLVEASDAQPDDDPAAQLIASAVAFRRWALENRSEFALVFTNVDVSCVQELQQQAATGLHFSELFGQVWAKYRFPVPAYDDLDPGLAEILRAPLVPADLSQFPDELRGLIWLLERSWAALYGTVTLEVYGHIDPRIVEQGHLFRAMIADQAPRLGLAAELPRLLALVDGLMAAG